MSSTSNSKLNKKTSSNKENNDKQIFERTIDAFFANDLDRKNVEEYIFKLFDDMIDWTVKKQFIVSIFIIEAKLFSMLHARQKAHLMNTFLSEVEIWFESKNNDLQR